MDDIVKILNLLNIEIRALDNSIKNIGDVIDGIAEKWETLDQDTKDQIAKAFSQ